MAEARSLPVPGSGQAVPAAPDGWLPWAEPWLQWQKLQWELFGTWQQALAAWQGELFDEWACRWAGGVPIDA